MAFNPYNNMAGLRNAYQMLTTSRNPMQVFQQLAQKNANLRPVLDALRSGTNPHDLFVSLCQQNGINPDEFIKNITGK